MSVSWAKVLILIIGDIYNFSLLLGPFIHNIGGFTAHSEASRGQRLWEVHRAYLNPEGLAGNRNK